MYSAKTKSALLKNVQRVKDFLTEIEMGETPFYIAGGSVFSTINGSEYSDIDVYFYKFTDLSLFKRKVQNMSTKYDLTDTENALTITSAIDIKVEEVKAKLPHFSVFDASYDEHPLQFIKCEVGEPYSVLKTFDINCCKICITSKGDIVIDESFSNDIRVDMNNFKTNSLQRVFKYINSKNAQDPGQKAQHDVIDFLVNNFDLQMKESYMNSCRTCLEELRIALGSYHSRSLHSYVHDKICEVYGEEDRIKYFERLIEPMLDLEFNGCDEYMLCKVMYTRNNNSNVHKYSLDYKHSDNALNASSGVIERIMDKYAEYFI